MSRALGLVLLCACAAPQKAAVPSRPDEQALAIPTVVKARHVVIVLSARFGAEAQLTSDTRTQPRGGTVVASGHAVLTLRKLEVEASEIELRFQSDPAHEDFLLYAHDVALFERQEGYGHRTETADLVTMSNSEVRIFVQ